VLDSFVVAHSVLQTSVSERNTGYYRMTDVCSNPVFARHHPIETGFSLGGFSAPCVSPD
jgi:hypothetical protein